MKTLNGESKNDRKIRFDAWWAFSVVHACDEVKRESREQRFLLQSGSRVLYSYRARVLVQNVYTYIHIEFVCMNMYISWNIMRYSEGMNKEREKEWGRGRRTLWIIFRRENNLGVWNSRLPWLPGIRVSSFLGILWVPMRFPTGLRCYGIYIRAS